MSIARRCKRFVDHTASVNLNGQIINVPPSYIGRWVYVYTPGLRIAPVEGTLLPKRRRLFLMACFLTGQSPECFPKGETLRNVVVRWRQGFEAFENSAEKGVIEISGGFEASPASRKRVRGKGILRHPAGGGGSL